MFKSTLSKAINYYDNFHDILIADASGIIEYSSVYDRNTDTFRNEAITGMHILDVYPELTEENSSVLKCIKTGKTIYDTVQKLTNINNVTSYFVSTDFPIISKGSTIGVIETSREISKTEFMKIVNKQDKDVLPKLYRLEDIKTESPALLEIKSTIEKIADSESTVLIIGETGTGKDMIAQAIHSQGYRGNKPFIVQNCAAIPSTLLESTFFGTVKGAFTGAENTKGLFEIANGGTIFLDEINSMDIYLQAKILKVVEDKSFRPIGSVLNKQVDVRIISATNRNPKDLIKEGSFREDLFYRLGVVRLEVPPLRKRKEDIQYIANHFIEVFNKSFHKNVTQISAIAQEVLNNHKWYGNVRELQNVMEYIFNFIDKTSIQIEDLPAYLYDASEGYNSGLADVENGVGSKFLEADNASLSEKLRAYEKNLIIDAVNSASSLSEAADMLKISAPSLQYKLKKYNLK